MKNKQLFCRFSTANKFLFALFLLVCPLAYTYAACCAGHGGVASCNQTTGFKMCKDGTASPTCKCPKAKPAKKTKATKSATPVTTAPTTITKPVPSTKPAAKKPVKNTSNQSARGCCSKHGGVAQCNKSTGYLTCKDGSQSASCACH